MQHSKINLQFKNIFQIGVMFNLGLLLMLISLISFEDLKQYQFLIIIGLICYLFFLLIKKYKIGLSFIATLLCLFCLLIKLDKQTTKIDLNRDQCILVYPDQIKIRDNWLSGIGKIKKRKVRISAKVSDEQSKIFKSGQALLLSEPEGEMADIKPATNFGEFDYQHYYRGKKIYQDLKLNSFRIIGVDNSMISKFHAIRYRIQMYFLKMPKLLSFFSSELILAESTDNDGKDIIDHYRDLGIIHLLSISGLHVGIYTLGLSVILYWLKVRKEYVFVACCLMLILGMLLSDFQAGFVRASLIYIFGKIFSFYGIKISGYDLLGIVVMVHLLIVPRLFMNVGAILSYLLFLGLLITSSYSGLVQSFFLNILLTPFLLINYSQINILTIFYNMLAVPYFNYIVMPITFFNLICFSIFKSLSEFLEQILQFFENLVGQISNSKIGLITFGKISWIECFLLLILTIYLIVIFSLNNKKAKPVFCLLGIMYLIVFCRIHYPLKGQVTFIDVGQGDSILITTPFPRKVYLIDTGGKLNFSKHKITPQVNRITVPFLKAQGIDHIDGLFVSHQDADHVGDVQPLMSQIKVDNLYMAKGLIKNPSFKKRVEKFANQTRFVELLAGMQIEEPKINFEVVYPFKEGSGKNEDSLSISFKLQNQRWLFTGDLGQEGEQELIEKFNFHADYFKLGHHGSKTSSNPEFLQKLSPKMVFISAGRNNRFGHPHQETLDTLKSQHIPWASTQDCGMISWYYGAGKPHFERFLAEQKE